MLTRAKISAVRASGVRRLFEDGAYSRAALINFVVPDAALIRGQRLIEGVAYSSKYGTGHFWIYQACTGVLTSSLLR